MSLHLQRFVDRVQAAEARGQRDLVLSISEAKDLQADLTRLLLNLESLRTLCSTSTEQVIEVQVSGGQF
jgi:type II secretory pathway predicted ATPase ExeA